MKILLSIAVPSALLMASFGAHAASFTGQTIDAVLTSNQSPGVVIQFASPIVAPGSFDGVIQDVFSQTWDVNVQVLANQVIIDWTGPVDGNIASGSNLLAIDLSGFTNGPVLGLGNYSCAPTGSFACGAFGPGPSISGLTSTSTAFDVSFNVLRSNETYVFTSVPEPATWAMMLAGFAGLSFAGYRRSKGAALIV